MFDSRRGRRPSAEPIAKGPLPACTDPGGDGRYRCGRNRGRRRGRGESTIFTRSRRQQPRETILGRAHCSRSNSVRCQMQLNSAARQVRTTKSRRRGDDSISRQTGLGRGISPHFSHSPIAEFARIKGVGMVCRALWRVPLRTRSRQGQGCWKNGVGENPGMIHAPCSPRDRITGPGAVKLERQRSCALSRRDGPFGGAAFAGFF